MSQPQDWDHAKHSHCRSTAALCQCSVAGAGLGARCSPAGCSGCISSSSVEPTSSCRVSSSQLRGRSSSPDLGNFKFRKSGFPKDGEEDKLRTLSSSPSCLYNLCCSWNQCHHFHPVRGLGQNPKRALLTQHCSHIQGHPGKVPGRSTLPAGVPHPLPLLTLSISHTWVCTSLTAPATLDIFPHSRG